MIIKKSIMKANEKSSFKRLVSYLVTDKVMGISRNVAVWTSSDDYDNDDMDLFLKDVKSVQAANTTSKDDKTYHLIVSFREDEIDTDKLKEIEKDIAASLGYAEHQRLCVVHNDTDNFHFHIAINKINPDNHKIHTPYRDYQKLNDIAVVMENKYSLIKDNHTKNEIPYSKADDIEKAGYLKSLKSYIADLDLSNITTWNDFHTKLNEAGIFYIKKGNGAVFGTADKKLYVKASLVNREYSLGKLENKFGAYEPYLYDKDKANGKYEKVAVNDKDNLYEQYKYFNEQRKQALKYSVDEINEEYGCKTNKEILNIKKLMDMTLLSNASYVEKVIINKVFYNLMKNKKEELFKEKKEKIDRVYDNNKYIRFDEWIRTAALENIAARKYIEKELLKENYFIADFSSELKKAVTVTKNGTYILKDNIRLNRQAINIRSLNEYSILKNLKYYKKIHPDKPLDIRGSELFKNTVIKVISENNLDIPLLHSNRKSLNKRKLTAPLFKENFIR